MDFEEVTESYLARRSRDGGRLDGRDPRGFARGRTLAWRSQNRLRGDRVSERTDVYDLGEIDGPRRKGERVSASNAVGSSWESSPRRFASGTRSRARVREEMGFAPRTNVPSSVTASLSLILPGAGQLAAGDPARAFFYFSSVGFIASATWAVWSTLPVLADTFTLLGIPARDALVGMFGLLVLAAACLHVGAVLQAHAFGAPDANAPHPLLAGAASLVVPGWGQALIGHRVRAALFLTGVWGLAGVVLWSVGPVVQALAASGVRLPRSVRPDWLPLASLTAGAVIWVLAVYDAVSSAAHARRF
jgi:hypothetical protein